MRNLSFLAQSKTHGNAPPSEPHFRDDICSAVFPQRSGYNTLRSRPALLSFHMSKARLLILAPYCGLKFGSAM